MATGVIARQQARGTDEPWLRDDFVDLIVRLQQWRQTTSVPDTVCVWRSSPSMATLSVHVGPTRTVTIANG